MLTSVRVHNFRAFGELTVESLGRVNLVTGRNNSGKTSLLEALFLLSGAGNPQLALNSNVIRSEGPVSGPRETVWEPLWKPMFHALNTDMGIGIEGNHSSGQLTLHISLVQPSTFEDSGEISTTNIASEFPVAGSTLLFSYQGGSGPKVEGQINVTGQGAKSPNVNAPFRTVILTAQVGSHQGTLQEDAARLGRLRKQKQGDLALRALKIIEPKLRSVEVNSASGLPLIWGDIGLPELVPLAAMGEGMTRIARLVLAIADAPGGLVLADEVENGLHHSVLPKVWEKVGEAAQQFNTQIVATTHSAECVQAASQALKNDLLLHRLEVSDSGNRCVTYQPEDIEATIFHHIEFR